MRFIRNRKGRWRLVLLVVAVVLMEWVAVSAAPAATIMVNSSSDSGSGTLREALAMARSGDTIVFDAAVFPPGAPATIALTSALPDITQGDLTIDGTGAGVILEGSGTPADTVGISIMSSGNGVVGLQIVNFPDAGIRISSGAGDNTIGGDTPEERNVISGNGGSGVLIRGSGTDANAVVGNYIGTDVNGTVALPNAAYGVEIIGGAKNNTVGGPTDGERNIISGNSADGVRIQDEGSDDNEILGNYIGASANGLDSLGNGHYGTWLYDVDGTRVEGNLVANNDWGGMFLAKVTSTAVSGNRIGVNAAGEAAGNASFGVWLGYYAHDNLIGGPDLADGNVIAHNGDTGIEVHYGETYANTFSHNSIYSHLQNGIELYGGANDNIVRPVVTSSDSLTGHASGTACPSCTVEVSSDDDDEARWYEGSTTADGSGNWSFNKGSPFSGPNVQATATDASRNTSELSGAAPSVHSVFPSSAAPGTADLGVTIHGGFFEDNEPLAVNLGTGVWVTDTRFISSTEIHTYLSIDSGASPGPRDVDVINYDGQSGTATGAFTVVGTSPFPPPLVESITPTVGLQGKRMDLTIYGQNFVDRPTVAFTGEDITVNSVTTISSTELLVDLAISDQALPGLHELIVTNPDGKSDTLLGAFEVQVRLFSDVSFWAGIGTAGQRGVAWGDYDGDGYEDLFVTNHNVLYRNNGDGTFSDTTNSAGLQWTGGEGVAWGDYDNDGDLDLYTSDWGSGDALSSNQGDGTFADVTEQAGIWDPGHGQTVAWADYDGDGDLDLYVANTEGDPNLLFRNEGDGTFSDATIDAGVTDNGDSQSVAWGDYNGDGAPDLYVSNGSQPNRLFENQDDGTFIDRAAELGVTALAYGWSTGVAWGDYDNDGDLDLAVSAEGTAVLYRNDGDGFADVTTSAGVDSASVGGQALAWGDYDSDGWLDLYVSDSEDSVLYRNRGDGSFADVTEATGVTSDRNWGAAWADYDNDGDLDLFVVRGGLPELGEPDLPDFLFRNNGNSNHWLHVKLIGTTSNWAGIGARVRAIAGGLTQIREVSGGSGRTSQDSLPIEFGLGTHADTVTVEVTWPSGVVDTLTGIAVDQLLTVTESTPTAHSTIYLPVILRR